MSEYRDRNVGDRLKEQQRAELLEQRRRELEAEHAREHALENKLRAIAAEPPPEGLEGAAFLGQSPNSLLPTGRARISEHNKRYKWLYITLTVLILLLGVLVQVLTHGHTVTLTAPKPATQFYVDGKLVCSRSPCRLDLDDGDHDVRVVSGDKRGQKRIHVYGVRSYYVRFDR